MCLLTAVLPGRSSQPKYEYQSKKIIVLLLLGGEIGFGWAIPTMGTSGIDNSSFQLVMEKQVFS